MILTLDAVSVIGIIEDKLKVAFSDKDLSQVKDFKSLEKIMQKIIMDYDYKQICYGLKCWYKKGDIIYLTGDLSLLGAFKDKNNFTNIL